MRSLVWSVVLLCLVSVGYGDTAPAPPSAPTLVLPGKSAIVIFERHLVSGDDAGDIYLAAQKVSGDGKLLWKEGTGWVDVATKRGCLQRAVSAVPDGQGGAIIVFESEPRSGKNAGDCDLLVQRIDAEGRLLWNHGDPATVADSSADEMRPFAVRDGNGGVIVAYEKHEGDRVTLLAQRISSSGSAVWSGPTAFPADSADSNRKRLSAVMPDGEGGMFAVYEVRYTSGEYASDCDLHAQRLSGSGARLWTEDEMGATVSSAAKLMERGAALVSDDQGGLIAVFEAEWRSGEHEGDGDIYGQRLDRNGKKLWNEGDKSATVSSAKRAERAVVALPDGRGGLLAVFESESREGERRGDCDVYAQRLDAEGKMLWNEGKKSSSVASSKWGEKRPGLVWDNVGGAIIVFEQHAPTDNYAGDIDLAADRISAEGKLLWSSPENNRSLEVAAEEDLLERNPVAVPDGAGGVLAVYEAEARIGKYAGRSDLLAQRLSAAGKPLWLDGKPLTVAGSEESEKNPVVVVP